mgnify:CR=1 FL=1
MGDESELDLTALALFESHTDGVLVGGIITNNVVALPTMYQSDANTILTLGSTGSINVMVGGTENLLNISKDAYTSNIRMTSLDGMQLVAGNDSNTVDISGAKFSYNSGQKTQTIHAGVYSDSSGEHDRNMLLKAQHTSFSGSAQFGGDIITNGHAISKSINVAKTEDNNISIGYGFQINTEENLELYKFDRRNNFTQRIATFGDGSLVSTNNAFDSFPVFGQREYGPNDQLILGVNSNMYNHWDHNGANIFYLDGKVGIGTSNFNQNDYYKLEVYGKTYLHETLKIKDGVTINGRNMTDVSSIAFLSAGNIFTGSLSTINFDYIPANTTWVQPYQHVVPLSGFLNDMKLDDFYTGNSTTLWLDNDQSTIPLSGFSNDMKLNDFYTGTSSSLWIDKEQDKVLLTAFSNDITHFINLKIDDLIVSRLGSNLVPYSNDTISLGSPTHRFKDFYLSGNTVHIGDAALGSTTNEDGSASLEVQAAFKVNTLVFPDGSSMETTFTESSEGGQLGDFDSIIGGMASSTATFKIIGKYNFGVNHIETDTTRKYTWRIVNIDNTIGNNTSTHNLLVPNHSTGMISINYLTSTYSTFQVSSASHTNIEIPFVNFDGAIASTLSDNVSITPYEPHTANDFSPLRNYDPSSIKFKNKFKADFDYYHNNRRYNNPDGRSAEELWGFYSGEVALDKFVNFNHPGLHVDSSKHYIVEYIQYYSTPFYKFVDDTDKYIHYIPGNMNSRLVSYYRRNSQGNVTLVQNETIYPYNIFPKIIYKSWDNSVNDTEFQISFYDTRLNWTVDNTPPANNESTRSNVISKFTNLGGNQNWIRTLLEITYSYIKYGIPNALTTGDKIITDAKTIVASDIVLNKQGIGTFEFYNMIYFNSSIFSVLGGNLNIA